MTPREFKAWFDGFTEAFTGAPTKAQWGRIKERVAEIDGNPVTERVFVDRYLPYIGPYYPSYTPNYVPYWVANGVGQTYATSNTVGLQCGSQTLNTAASNQVAPYYAAAQGASMLSDSANVMTLLGQAEAQGLNS